MLESREKRLTRGIRVTVLSGEDATFDEEFYNSEIWKEAESEDDDYASDDVEEQPDQFDSDFNDSEDDDEDDEEEEDLKRQKPQLKPSKYKEPTTGTKTSHPTTLPTIKKRVSFEDSNDTKEEKPKRIKRSKGDTDTITFSRASVRDSTKSKTQIAEIARQEAEKVAKSRNRPRPIIKTYFMQEELLKEALNTEIENIKWLENQRRLASESDTISNKLSKHHLKHGEFIRHLSRRGQYDVIIFPNTEAMPDIFKGSSLPETPTNNICVITGLRAKYRDPKTMLPYANLEAYKILKKKYHKSR